MSRKKNPSFIDGLLDFEASRRVNGNVTVAELSKDGVTWKPLGKHVADTTTAPWVAAGIITPQEAEKIAEDSYNEVRAAAKIGASIDLATSLFHNNFIQPHVIVKPIPITFNPVYSAPVIVQPIPITFNQLPNNTSHTCYQPQPQFHQSNNSSQNYVEQSKNSSTIDDLLLKNKKFGELLRTQNN